MRVLVVEDDARLAAQLGEALREAGYAVDLLSDGQAAWVHGGVEPVDAVVLDLGLPRLDGLTVLRRWREEGRALGMSENELEQFVDAFEHGERAAARKLSA